MNVNEIMKELIDSVVTYKVPELKDESYDKKVYAFVRYAIENDKKLFSTQNIVTPTTPRKSFETKLQERNYYFNKSHEYFAQF